ncbi:MAG: M14 family zinc carboxypeptidase, partial [Patescibacteria group bacterium]|nr:M14 family zinc carboxypeptidase [Patescibacteria group bacterium]
MKNTIIVLLVLIVVGFIGYFLVQNLSDSAGIQNTASSTTQQEGGDRAGDTLDMEQDEGKSVIGTSVEGRDIIAYHYGTGDTEILLVGGIHGGYSWNTALVANEMMDYLAANPDVTPANVKVTVIPALNPDGLFRVFGTTSVVASSIDISKVSQELQTSG